MELGTSSHFLDEELALSHLRKESLDLYNRIHSIFEDVAFVNEVRASYPQLPVIPNLRCGAWYVDSLIAAKEPAYFKSTDGHFGNWSFNLRRPNLHLLSTVITAGGLILVDSTRAGKRIPDALSKTVPIWCAVINRAVRRYFSDSEKSRWDTKLYCPPGVVSAQEQDQIETRLDDWAESLLVSQQRSLTGPLWITPSTSGFPRVLSGKNEGFFSIICVSASKQVQDGLERRSNGFAYVQGSGDDHELWAMGLTPQLFWENTDEILEADRSGLPVLILSLVKRSQGDLHNDKWGAMPTSIFQTDDLILVGAVPDLPTPLQFRLPDIPEEIGFVIITSSTNIINSIQSQLCEERQKSVLLLQMSEGKKEQIHFLQTILPRSLAFIGARLSAGIPTCICCDSGKDASVGVALAVLQTFFDDSGGFLATTVQQEMLRNSANKQSISKRLQWIISSRPQANPSRATLKRVNEFFLTSSSFRRQRRA
ncbi:hypothetical protein AcV7_001869 [Taiwanofungus camphoratus]|nr:hypothetical protein AcV7_001869 [Antrodia cinnamomea]